jgi:hypothetical protein
MNDSDKENLKWLKEFQKFDLYSKLPQKPNVDELLPYYKKVTINATIKAHNSSLLKSTSHPH